MHDVKGQAYVKSILFKTPGVHQVKSSLNMEPLESPARISYSSKPSFWYALEFSNPTLNTFAIAAVTTLISYQVTAIIFDVVLGFKKRQVSTVNSLQTILLVRQSSPLAVLNSILRRDWVTKLYFRREIPDGMKISRDPNRIKLGVLTRCVLLLFAAPVINVLSVVLTLDSTKEMTFESAGIDKLALGVNPNLSVLQFSQENDRCRRAAIDTADPDESLAEFTLCSTIPFTQTWWDLKGEVAVYLFDEKFFFIQVQTGTTKAVHIVMGGLRAKETSYALKANVNPKGIEALLKKGIRMVSDVCQSNASTAIDINLVSSSEVFAFIAAKQVPCNVGEQTEKDSMQIAGTLAAYLTFVSSDKMEIVQVSQNTTLQADRSYFEADRLVLLRRRERNLGLLGLAVIATGGLLIRIFTAIVSNNDVEEGVQLVMKDAFGLSCCSSFLQGDNKTMECHSEGESVHRQDGVGQNDEIWSEFDDE